MTFCVKSDTILDTVNELHDLQKYKKAKIILKDLEEINQLLKQFIKAVGNPKYGKYVLVKDIISNLLLNRSSLDGYIKKYKQIVETKGNVDLDGELAKIKK